MACYSRNPWLLRYSTNSEAGEDFAVPAGVALKWTRTEAIARWQMATGTTMLERWVTRLGAWIQWLFLPYLPRFSLVASGMLASAGGVAGAALFPLGDLQFSRVIWATVHSLPLGDRNHMVQHLVPAPAHPSFSDAVGPPALVRLAVSGPSYLM